MTVSQAVCTLPRRAVLVEAPFLMALTRRVSTRQGFTEEMTMLDHGILNVPLAKRGDIDAQIDKYKAQVAKEARSGHKAALARGRESSAEAKRILAAIEASPGLLDRVAADRKTTRRGLLQLIREIARGKPSAMKDFERDWLLPKTA